MKLKYCFDARGNHLPPARLILPHRTFTTVASRCSVGEFAIIATALDVCYKGNEKNRNAEGILKRKRTSSPRYLLLLLDIGRWKVNRLRGRSRSRVTAMVIVLVLAKKAMKGFYSPSKAFRLSRSSISRVEPSVLTPARLACLTTSA